MGERTKGFRDARLYGNRRSRFIWCRVRTPAGKILRQSTKCTNEAAASRAADVLERRAADPRLAAAQTHEWQHAVKAMLAELVRRGRAAATIDKVERKLGHFPRIWGTDDAPALDMPLAEIDSEKWGVYADARLKEGVARITIRDELAALRQVLKLAYRHKKFAEDPKTVLPEQWETGHKPRTRWLPPDEYEALRAQLPEKRRAHLDYSIAVGGRMSEVFRARVGDVDGTTVLVRGSKTEDSWSRIPITRITKPLLERALEQAPRPDDEHLFLPWGKINRDLKAACARAGIATVSTNDLRRTFGKWHRNAGVVPSLLGPMLRHTTDTLAQTTYGKVVGDELGHLVEQQLGMSNLHDTSRGNDQKPEQPEVASERKEAKRSVNTATEGAPGSSRNCDLGFRKAEDKNEEDNDSEHFKGRGADSMSVLPRSVRRRLRRAAVEDKALALALAKTMRAAYAGDRVGALGHLRHAAELRGAMGGGA